MAAAVDVACGKADLALLSPLAWFGRNSAEGYGIPSMGLHLQPLEPTRAFPPATIAARSLGGPLNRALGRKLQAMMVDPHLGIVNDLRALHGLKPTTVAAHADASRNWPVLHGFSEHVVPRPDDWPAEKSVTGYWWPPTPKNWTPDPVLLDFLESGPRPVFVGFGSTSPMDPEALSQLVERVTERMRLRAVVQSGWAELSSSAAHVLTVGSVPHEWLFPRMRALVHHAGAGTTAAAVRAGVPSVPVPMALDQPFWAHRLHRAGIAARPVPARRLTAGALERSLTEVVGGQRLADAASRLASLVATDDGAETARRLIEQYRA
jgi:UDP:flavonoid glycosyltransferase YjiC (YdhE family)